MSGDAEWVAAMADLTDEFIGIMREVDDEGIGAAARLDARIAEIFTCFTCGRGDAAERMKAHLSNAKKLLLQETEVHFNGARRDMERWHGAAAEQFIQYLNRLEFGIRTLMVDRIDTLLMILTSYQKLHYWMRMEVCDLVQHTRDGIAAAETDGWKVGAQIVSAVVGIVSAAAGAAITGPPGVVLVAIAGTMLQGGLGVAIEAKGADSELGVLVELVDSGEGMIRLIDGERARIEEGLRELAGSVTDTRLPEVRPERPLIITAPDFSPSTFGLTDQEQGRHQRPTDTRDLVPEPKKQPDGPRDRITTPDGQTRDIYPEQGPA